MELRKGYKQTEVGVIPEDWEIKSIEELCIPSGLVRGPFGGALKKESFVESGYKVYEQKNAIYGNVNLGTYYIDKSKFIELKRFEILKDDFILSCSGTIGKLYQIPKSFEQGIINQALLKITINGKIYCDKYFFHFFVWDKFQAKIIDNTQGGAMKNLVGMPIFKATKIPLPSTKSEQTSIATALSDADALISSLENLIEKKRNIKQGAMQQLLNGKMRLDGFKDTWPECDIASLCLSFTKQTGFDYSAYIKPSLVNKYEKGTIPFIQNKDFNGFFINFDTDYFVPEKIADAFPRILLNEKCLLISISGSIGRVAIFSNAQKAFIGGAVAVGKFKDRSLLEWVMFNLQSQKGQEKLFINVKQGSHQNLILDDIRKIKIPIPSRKERDKIVLILTDIENEILSLEKKLLKSKMLKQGMMQELLTGKIRLR